MKFFTTPVVLIFLCVLILLHAISVVTKGTIAKTTNYVNIILHIAMFVLMLNNKFDIDEAVLVYMISLFMYTFFAVTAYRVAQRRKRKMDMVRERFENRRSIEEGRV